MSRSRSSTEGRTPARRGAPAPRPSGPSAALRGVGSLIALLALVVGVPLLLLWLGDGLPIPTSWPDRDTLTSQVGTDELVTVLVAITWLAWLQFVVCVGVELVSELRGVGLPARVPFAGPSQRLARSLVAGVVLLVTLIGAGGTATAATVVDRAPSVAAISATPLATSTVQAQNPTAVAATQQAPAPTATVVTGAPVGQKTYTVQPPQGRHHDSLWDIAERCLGDGRRYKEIFNLNAGREQPDGEQLTIESLIYPGWVLIMPDDAVGVDAVLPPAPAPAPAPGAGRAARANRGAGQRCPGLGRHRRRSARLGVGIRRQRAAPDLVAAGLLTAGLSAALFATRRRNRAAGPPEGDAADAEVAIRVGADPGRAAMLDGVLRRLAVACRRTGRDLPAAYAARILDGRVELTLATADDDPPKPWTSRDGGRIWSCPAEAAGLPEVSNGEALAPYPGLVGVGRDDDGAHVLIDLEAAGGVVSVVGDSVLARETVLAAAVELATNAWSDHLRVTLVDLPAEVASLAPGRMRSVDSVADVFKELEQRAKDLRRSGDSVLTGRLLQVGGDAWMPEYLVLGSEPSDEDMIGLVELLGGGPRAPFGVLVAGDVPAARWRLHAGADGRLTSDVLGIDVEAQRLSESSAAALVALFDDARQPGDDTGHGLRSVDEASLPEDRAPLPPDFTPSTSGAAWSPAANNRAMVRILGSIEVETTGNVEPSRIAQVEEIAVFLALHPNGVHPSALSAALWPRESPSPCGRRHSLGSGTGWASTRPGGPWSRSRTRVACPCDRWDWTGRSSAATGRVPPSTSAGRRPVAPGARPRARAGACRASGRALLVAGARTGRVRRAAVDRRHGARARVARARAGRPCGGRCGCPSRPARRPKR